MAETGPQAPVLTLPPQEEALLREVYGTARVILEYGSGGSTVLAGDLAGQGVTSVESDADWCAKMEGWFAANPPRVPVRLHHADVGPTGAWGRPTGRGARERWPRYPLGVWDLPGFVHPDVVLIDGRFRAACFLATLFRISRPVVVLWDDYAGRPAYHQVERFARPVALAGRMARFEVSPATLRGEDLLFVIEQFGRVQ